MNSSMALSKTRVSNAQGSPRGTQMPSPRAAIKLRMPHPRDWQREQMPRGCPGGGGMRTAGIDWCISRGKTKGDNSLKRLRIKLRSEMTIENTTRHWGKSFFIAKTSKFQLWCRLLFFPIQTFINSNRCNTTPPYACCKAKVTFRVAKLGGYVK